MILNTVESSVTKNNEYISFFMQMSIKIEKKTKHEKEHLHEKRLLL